MHANPATRAFAETNVILAAYLEGLSSLYALVDQDPEVDHIVQGMYANFVTLREVRDTIRENMEKADVMIEAIEAKLVL
jgi:hypothetical protein